MKKINGEIYINLNEIAMLVYDDWKDKNNPKCRAFLFELCKILAEMKGGNAFSFYAEMQVQPDSQSGKEWVTDGIRQAANRYSKLDIAKRLFSAAQANG